MDEKGGFNSILKADKPGYGKSSGTLRFERRGYGPMGWGRQHGIGSPDEAESCRDKHKENDVPSINSRPFGNITCSVRHIDMALCHFKCDFDVSTSQHKYHRTESQVFDSTCQRWWIGGQGRAPMDPENLPALRLTRNYTFWSHLGNHWFGFKTIASLSRF